jgi:asparagine synthase (glutamine-hydrolysing)
MCGISVVIAAIASPEIARTALRMHAPIRHRGPDGEGFLLVDRGHASRFDQAEAVPLGATASLALAFRRLKIVDLSDAAGQPMASPDGQRWIVFNGDIYNFQALRSELAASGRQFKTSGDTEVILAAYERWGEDCFRRLEGMWAFVIIDLLRQRVVACRDRFGIKPLYYHLGGDALLLASEIRQILAAGVSPRANRDLVRRFLAGDRDTVLDDTFFADIHSVPPGCWSEFPLNGQVQRLDFKRYWDLDDFQENRAIDYRSAVERVGHLMANAVRSHSVADVRVGSLLSGGLDSSTIATLLVRQRRSDWPSIPTFSFGFRSAAPEYCELPFVDKLVRAEQIENHETSFSADWVGRNADRIVSALEEPPLAVPAFAQFRTFELCRQHGTTVVLDGQGSDEIFAGYPYHERLLLIDLLRHGRWARFSAEASAIAERNAVPIPRLLAKSFLMPRLSAVRRKIDGRDRWIPSTYGNRTSESDRSRSVNQRLHHDVKWGNAKIILAYADKNAMQFSIEARVPYFDRELVEFAFGLPAEFKVAGGVRKRVLRDFARTILPAEIPDRRDRVGFATPDAVWLGGALWPQVREEVMHSALNSNPSLDSRRVKAMVDDFERGRFRDHRAIWRIWMLSIWQRVFSVAL